MSPGLVLNYVNRNKTLSYLLNFRKSCAKRCLYGVCQYVENYLREPNLPEGRVALLCLHRHHAISRCREPRDETPGLMGKSKKKIKADQINVLRKQYDAFLEEDKKRKERNEHILEKLDSMRLSNTIVRYKSNVYLDQRVSFNCIGETPVQNYPHPHATHPINPLRKCNEHAIPREIDVVAKPLDETYVLNEISKKYILIPKLRSIAGADYIPKAIKQDNNNDSDWKSKYSILDKLKQNEKEETNSFAVLKDHGKSFLDDIPTKEREYRFDDKTNPIKDEFVEVETDLFASKYDTSSLACQDEKGTINQVTTDVKKQTPKEQSDVTPKLNSLPKTFKTDTDSGQLQQSNRGSADFEARADQNIYPTQNVSDQLASYDKGNRHNDATYNDKYENEDTEKLSPVVDDIRHVEEIDSLKPEAPKTSGHPNTPDSEKLQYPIDIINVQDFTPAEGVALVDGVNINPDNHNIQQSYMSPSDQYPAHAPTDQGYLREANQPQSEAQYLSQPTGSSEQIHIPVANQLPRNDHYVSEPTASEQIYLPGDQQTPIEDQYVSEQVVGAAEQQDHAKDNLEQQQQEQGAYEQTEDFRADIQAFEDEQNQMFYSEQTNYQDQNTSGEVYDADINYDPTLYYGGVQQEAAYPVEINEHEETSQQYDPSYEEQYTAQQYNEQQLGEQQQYAHQQHYGDQQQYGDQQYAEQQHYADPTVAATLQEYDPAYTLQEQTIEQIEQQLDSEELRPPSQIVGYIADEPTLYAQNANTPVKK